MAEERNNSTDNQNEKQNDQALQAAFVGALMSSVALGYFYGIERYEQHNNEKKHQKIKQEYTNSLHADLKPHDDIGEIMARQIMLRGEATLDEIFKASFGGEWPPKGLNVVMPNSQRVDVRNILETIQNEENLAPDELLRHPDTPLGNARTEGRREVGLNSYGLIDKYRYGYSRVNSTLGHEGVHIAQGDNNARASQTYFTSEVQNSLYGSKEFNAYKAVAGIFEKYELPEDAQEKHGYNYLSDGLEIQARLHQGMMEGYRYWGKLPATPVEFHAALQDLGFNLSDNLKENLESKPEYAEAKRQFSGFNGRETYFVSQVNSVAARLQGGDKERFWQRAMPEMYADLIEMYGDKEGRARFGMGPNERFENRKRALIETYVHSARTLNGAMAELHGDDGYVVRSLDSARHYAEEMIEREQFAPLQKEAIGNAHKAFAVTQYANDPMHYKQPSPLLVEEFERLYDAGGEKAIVRALEIKKYNELSAIVNGGGLVEAVGGDGKPVKKFNTPLDPDFLYGYMDIFDNLGIDYRKVEGNGSPLHERLEIIDGNNRLSILKEPITHDPLMAFMGEKEQALYAEHNAKNPPPEKITGSDSKTRPPIELDRSKMSHWGQMGGNVGGLGLGAVGLYGAVQEGDRIGIAISTADVTTSGVSVAVDTAAAAGKNISPLFMKAASKANIAVMLADGVYQITKEEGADNKAVRAAAVGVTAGTGIGIGMATTAVAGSTAAAAGTTVAAGAAVTTAATAGAAALATTAATVAIPIATTVAVGMAADSAVDAYKATEALDEAIVKNEQIVQKRVEREVSGAPKLSNYMHLNLFVVQEGNVPGATEGMSLQEKAHLVRNHEYSRDTEALDDLERRLEDKIAGYDKTIEENDSIFHDSVRFFWDEESIDEQRQAKMDRAQYVAALAELKEYRKEVDERNNFIRQSKEIDEFIERGIERIRQKSQGEGETGEQKQERPQSQQQPSKPPSVQEWQPIKMAGKLPENVEVGKPCLRDECWKPAQQSVQTIKTDELLWVALQEFFGIRDNDETADKVKAVMDKTGIAKPQDFGTAIADGTQKYGDEAANQGNYNNKTSSTAKMTA